eukprot:gb/GECG01015177.1/.p1 GENE.gb/GECG01015177.1/~~gb/GECG01015177.1/.p1  ORF type:complete len:229 (+),score=11.63 gb/GECG01015177.1/:1-687(+)
MLLPHSPPEINSPCIKRSDTLFTACGASGKLSSVETLELGCTLDLKVNKVHGQRNRFAVAVFQSVHLHGFGFTFSFQSVLEGVHYIMSVSAVIEPSYHHNTSRIRRPYVNAVFQAQPMNNISLDGFFAFFSHLPNRSDGTMYRFEVLVFAVYKLSHLYPWSISSKEETVHRRQVEQLKLRRGIQSLVKEFRVPDRPRHTVQRKVVTSEDVRLWRQTASNIRAFPSSLT